MVEKLPPFSTAGYCSSEEEVDYLSPQVEEYSSLERASSSFPDGVDRSPSEE
jgi:hypothetical protein